MKKVDLDAVLDEESFEEVSEDCAYTVEGGCGSTYSKGKKKHK